MPLRTTTYSLDDEVQRLEDELEEMDDVLEEADEDNPVVQNIEEDYPQLSAQLQGVRWARDEAFEADYAPMWDAPVDEITLAGLTGGEFGSIEDDIGENGGGQGAIRVYQVAKGTVDAPYIDDSMSEDEKLSTVADLPISYLKWAQARIDEMTGVGGNERMSYREFYEETSGD